MNTTESVTLPLHAGIVRAWAQQMAEAANRVNELIQIGVEFIDRDVTGMRGFLLYGTEVDRERGLLISPSPEHDGTEFSFIRPYAMSTNVWDKLVIPTSNPRVGDIPVSSDPKEIPFQTLVHALDVAPCSRIFVLDGAGSAEHAMLCFPVLNRKDAFLLVMCGGRYHERQAHFFQGDLAEYAATRKRMPRNLDEFQEATGGTSVMKDWPLHEAPAELTMTSDASGKLIDSRPVLLRDLTGNAITALMRGGWLTSR